LSASSRKRKKCSETCPDSRKPIAISEEGVLVEPEEACAYEGYGEPVGAFAFLRKREGSDSRVLVVNAFSVGMFLVLSYVYALDLSHVTTIDVKTAFLGYAGSVLFLTSLEVMLAFILARAKGALLRPALAVVPSPLPALLPLFDVEKEFCTRGDYLSVLSVALLASVLVATGVAFSFSWMVLYPKTKLELVYVSPFSTSWLSGVYGPVVSGAVSFMLGALFQLSFYPYSPSWALFGASNVLYPLLVGLALSVSKQGLGAVVGGYVLTATLLSIFVKERPTWKDPFSGVDPLGVIALLITLFLVALVG